MDDWPQTKLPRDFISQGFEVIGDPTTSCDGFCVWFRDGVFEGYQFPGQVNAHASSPERAEAWGKEWRRQRGEQLALQLLRDPSDSSAKAELKAIRKQCREAKPEEKATAAAIRSVLKGGRPTTWPSQNRRETAAVIAVSQLCEELNCPPTEAQVIDRMRMLKHYEDGAKLTVDGDDGNLADFLRSGGFGWLERRPRGYHREQ